MSTAVIFTIGFAAQLLFSARTLLQWIKSEKAKMVVSPSSYWVLSVIGSWLFFIYGYLRNDFSIILGQFISYYIYLWNLNLKGLWKQLHLPVRIVLISTPFIAAGFMFRDSSAFTELFLQNKDIPLWLVIFGSAGQVTFTLRFVYQWFYSIARHESSLPRGFWIISLIGSGSIIAYGILRHDPVLILGQSFGFVAYFRNLVIGYRSRKLQTIS
ncbi:MAG: lipid-A-disaccharide synthase N-terminal domain-containing protein [Bacteroidales bacterium]|nr:lipid-A-disaccharide synthase N-terminal domain-containing protein [Bacteroidales bacterium]